MPTATKNRKPAAAEQRAVLGSLSQQVAAELVGKPSIWLRDHPEIAVRNDDDTYDARTLVRNVLGVRPPTTLPDDLMEGVLRVIETCERDDGHHELGVAALEEVERLYGSAGLAAVGAELILHLRELARLEPHTPHKLPPEEEFADRAAKEAADKARREHRAMAIGWDARMQGRELYTCDKCKRYRLGSKWLTPPLPTGYVADRITTVCPKCAKRIRR